MNGALTPRPIRNQPRVNQPAEPLCCVSVVWFVPPFGGNYRSFPDRRRPRHSRPAPSETPPPGWPWTARPVGVPLTHTPGSVMHHGFKCKAAPILSSFSFCVASVRPLPVWRPLWVAENVPFQVLQLGPLEKRLQRQKRTVSRWTGDGCGSAVIESYLDVVLQHLDVGLLDHLTQLLEETRH